MSTLQTKVIMRRSFTTIAISKLIDDSEQKVETEVQQKEMKSNLGKHKTQRVIR